jgi:circadian clock protein KaiC
VIVLKTGSAESVASAEQTMVDGIVELTFEPNRMRTHRRLSVTKLRGSAFLEGKHAYCITSRGMELFPRIEVALSHARESMLGPSAVSDRISTGVEGLDPLFGGALVRGTTTLMLGSSGAGKTTLSLQFALEGARLGQPTLFYGFFEPPHSLRRKAEGLGVPIAELEAKGLLTFAWRSSSETMLDREAHDLLSLVREKKIERIALDGFAGLRDVDERERVASAFAAVSNELSHLGVTTFVTDETRELFVRDIHVPTSNVSALFHNIVFLRQVEKSAALIHLIGILKTRDSTHDSRLWELENGSQGVRILRPFAPTEHGLMRGGDGSDD